MNNLENLPEELFDLIANKPYSTLTKNEQQQIEAYMSKEDFETYHMMLQDFMELDANLEIPETAIPDLTLNNSIQQNKQVEKQSMLRKILTYRIPVYQVAAAVLFFMLSTFLVSNFKSDVKKTSNSIEETKPIPTFVKSVNSSPEIRTDSIVQKTGKSLAKDEYPDGLIFSM